MYSPSPDWTQASPDRVKMTGLDWVAAENPGDWMELDWVWVKLDWVWVEVTGSGLGTIAGNGSADWPGPSLPPSVCCNLGWDVFCASRLNTA